MNQSESNQQQIAAETPTGSAEPLTMFFAVGMLINLALIAAFVLWAVRQWKKSGKPDSRNPD